MTTDVLSDVGTELAATAGAIGWLNQAHAGTPVMWHANLGRWLNARELECLGRIDEAFALWKKIDPEWGEPWNQGVKDRYEVQLPVYPTPKGTVPIVMEYQSGQPTPRGEVTAAEMYWLEKADGTRQEVQWQNGCWQPFFPRPYQQTL